MGRNKKLRVRLDSLRRRITDHRIKIALEQQRANPDRRLIRHWEVEIKAWEETEKKSRATVEERKAP
jgi:hypothetical protein